jgi:cytochrome b
MQTKTRIWDLPTRLFHWALVFCGVGLFVTAYTGVMLWHFRLGYAVLALLLFRLVWGFVGGRWSRFSSFFHSPAAAFRQLAGRGDPAHAAGHSPTGALSVFALLLILLAQVGTGLLSDDAISFAGPLAQFASSDTVDAATRYHKDIGQWLLAGLVGLHVAAVLFYLLIKKRNLTAAMLTGDKPLEVQVQPARDDARSRLLALVIFALCGGAVWGMVRWTGG